MATLFNSQFHLFPPGIRVVRSTTLEITWAVSTLIPRRVRPSISEKSAVPLGSLSQVLGNMSWIPETSDTTSTTPSSFQFSVQDESGTSHVYSVLIQVTPDQLPIFCRTPDFDTSTGQCRPGTTPLTLPVAPLSVYSEGQLINESFSVSDSDGDPCEINGSKFKHHNVSSSGF
jgi:hypothetical protein